MGFSADWLALRAPADRAARDEGLLRRAAEAAGPAPVVLDLGCGTGATVQALAPHLPEGTRWRLVDNDPTLLARAAEAAGVAAETVCADIADLDALPFDGATLVTASALLDLVSEGWVAALAARLRVPFYAALSYDGVMRWEPEDARDAFVTAAFNRHQRGDKGLGPALGPASVEAGAAIFARSGFAVARADSPWRLGPGEAPLQRALVAGIAAAATKAGENAAATWGEMRQERAGCASCLVGHGDILAVPRSAAREGDHAIG